MNSAADVAVVGGGVIGLALARELSTRGVDVAVIERGRIGDEASSAAAGLLTAQADADAPSFFFEFAIESRNLYPDWADAIGQETGIDVGWRRTGFLRCGSRETLERFLWQRDAGLPVERLGAKEIHACSAGRVNPSVSDALFFPNDSLVQNRHLVRALQRSLEMRGVRVLEGVPVTRFVIDHEACRGVETSEGTFRAARVVDAAGAWAALDPTLPFAVPVEPVRGQIVELADPGPFPTVLESEEVYLAPRAHGRVLVGSTIERTGFVKEVTAAAVARLLTAAIALAPSLESAAISDAWAGLRPGTPDGLPIIGESPIPGLYFATGHFRNGILLAPITALVVADLVTGAPVRELAPFAPQRFAAESVRAR